MNRLYKKSRILFAVVWIVIYIISLSAADNISALLGIQKSVTAAVGAMLAVILIIWMKNNDLFQEYGLCKSEIPPRCLLYYIPLAIMVSVNLWFGTTINLTFAETFFYIISMLLVGFLEEIIFRGFLFKAMLKDGVKSAVIVSSITFGVGHIVNLINGSGADLLANLLQIAYAMAAGFLFTILFYKSKTLWPCIFAHGILNALSVFANQNAMNPAGEILSAIVLVVIPLLYAGYIMKIVLKKIQKIP